MPCQNDNKINCHPGGFPDGRRVNGSEPSPGSEQIEHTKTECPYAKLCEREGNPRQLVSGSYQLDSLASDLSDSEQTKSSPHPNPLPRRGNRRNITSSPSGANFDGHAESQTQCPCEGLTIQGARNVKIQDRGKQPYEQQRITDAGEGWHWKKTLKTAALSLALSFFITAPAMADDPVTVPTDNHAYTLTKVEQAGVNTITKYEWSDTENKLVPQYYRLDLNKTEYGHPDVADDTKTFTVTTPNADGSGNAFEYEIKYYVDNSRLAPDRITTEQNGIDINNDFVGLNVTTSSSATGGAIYNFGTIGDITGDFIGNYASSAGTGTYSYAYGGAIYNNGTIGNITGDFIGNYASANYSAAGGAIYNSSSAEIGNITGDFIGNYATGNSNANGGAIYNYGTIGDITGNFIGNKSSMGGAICSIGTIGDITGDFIGNYAFSIDEDPYNTSAGGGAIIINSNSTTGNITGDFIGNTVLLKADKSEYIGAIGGAITISGQVKGITGDFIGNSVNVNVNDTSELVGLSVAGGAIMNFAGKLGAITGDFIGNYISYNGNDMMLSGYGGSLTGGGAIFNSGTIGTYENEQNAYSFIYQVVTIINSETKENFTVYMSTVSIDEIKQALADGKKLLPNLTAVSQKFTPEQYERYKELYTDIIESDDSGKYSISSIYDIFEGKDFAQLKEAITNSSFINNYVYAPNIESHGGAIYTSNDLLLSAKDGYTSVISGNYVEDKDGKRQEAIYVDSKTAKLTLKAENEGSFVINDQINGVEGYNLALDGDKTGVINLNNDVINANISLDNTNLYLGREDVFNQSQSLTLNSGSIYMNNQSVGTMHIPTLNLNGNTNISVDADLANKSMDRITADNYNITNDAKLNVNNVVLLSDAKEDVTNILFADTELKGSVAYTGVSPIAYSPIYKYEVTYNPDDGFFTFARSAGSSGPNGNISDAYNPAVLASPVAQQAGAYTTQLQAFNYAFQHADTFMNIPYLERVAIINSGKYALSPTGDATDVGTYSPLMIKQHDPGFWVKPYASFENVPLKNGPKVSNINYGTLIGYDSALTSVSHGFERVLTGYIGYNGASQRYQGVDAYQNGGLIGGTATFYKGNFFNATTLSVGATAGDASTMYGSENYTMLLAGIGNKTGYNFEFWDGKVILQPNFLISYTFVNTFDYNNAAGVRIESDPLHAIQLSPGLKLIGNTKNGWQPYIGVNMVWNLLDDSRVTANDVRLPEMSIRPYVQYGVGVQKRFKDKFLAFGQAMIHNGGRNGVSLSVGLRWKVGRE